MRQVVTKWKQIERIGKNNLWLKEAYTLQNCDNQVFSIILILSKLMQHVHLISSLQAPATLHGNYSKKKLLKWLIYLSLTKTQLTIKPCFNLSYTNGCLIILKIIEYTMYIALTIIYTNECLSIRSWMECDCFSLNMIRCLFI